MDCLAGLSGKKELLLTNKNRRITLTEDLIKLLKIAKMELL